MEGVSIESVSLIGENDSGSTYSISSLVSEGYLLAYRNKNSISGNHYHEGKSKGKNPEKVLLITGQIELYTKNMITNQETTQLVKAPALIKVSPFILHIFTAKSDISFLEFNSLEEHKNDTKYPD